MMISEPKNNGGYFRAYLEDLLEDSISFECMKNPLMDPHGHTFDIKTVNELVQKNLSLNPDEKRQGFLCPFTREWVNLADLYPNLMVKNITEKVGELEEKHKHFLKAQERKFRETTAKIVGEVSEEYKNIIVNLRKENELNSTMIATLENRCTLLSQENAQLKEEVKSYKSELEEKANTINLQAEKMTEQMSEIAKQKDVIEEKDKAFKEQKSINENRDDTIVKQGGIIKRQNEELEMHWLHSCLRICAAFAIGGIAGFAITAKNR